MRSWAIRRPNAPDTAIETTPGELSAELSQAYRRGRRDEQLRRRRSPILMLSLLAIAAIGAVILFYAAREGSFSKGGQVVDAQLSHTTGEVIPSAINDAADRSGAALQAAGQRLKAKGAHDETQTPPAPN